VEYSRKLEYLKREEELIKEEELEAEALLQPSSQTLQVPLQPLGPLLLLAAAQHSQRLSAAHQLAHTHTLPMSVCVYVRVGLTFSLCIYVLHTVQCVTNTCKRHAHDTHS